MQKSYTFWASRRMAPNTPRSASSLYKGLRSWLAGTPAEPISAGMILFSNYPDFQRCFDLGMQFDLDCVNAQFANGFRQVDFTPIELDFLRLERVGDVVGIDRPEEFVVVAHLHRNGAGKLFEDLGQCLGRRAIFLLATLALQPVFLQAFQSGLTDARRQFPGQEIITGIALSHLHC